MPPNELLILHYRRIDIYPPVINLTRYMDQRGVRVTLVSAYACGISFGQSVRVLAPSASRANRLLSTLYFNVRALMALWNFKGAVIYMESLSCWPLAFLFWIGRFRNRKVAAHFHEYFSEEDYERQSFLERAGRKLEKNFFHKLFWISHTNEDRLQLFHQEHLALQRNQLHTMPNFPPSSWLSPPTALMEPVKLVYIGSLDQHVVYLHEILAWLIKKEGRFTCDFYSMNAGPAEIELITAAKGVAFFKGSVPYDQLPQTLSHYHVGLILYRTFSLNFTYNAPNKLFEYLACGLDVWCSVDMVSSRRYVEAGVYPRVMMVDYMKLDDFDADASLRRDGLVQRSSPFIMENVYQEFFHAAFARN